MESPAVFPAVNAYLDPDISKAISVVSKISLSPDRLPLGSGVQ
jgi:hypothetical protein